MSSPLDLLYQGFRVSVGAAATLAETLQDNQRRQQTLRDLQTQLGEQTRIWAEKGAATEAEARRAVEDWLQQAKQKASPNAGGSNLTVSVSYDQAQRELEDLIQQITALKAELEQTRSQS
ncbi:MAG: hypothetical protein GC158_17250 [Cyanobacteria bacterium RI_101]|nr:hypothetical protein [Cyanobacteria bacterium RI_101]